MPQPLVVDTLREQLIQALEWYHHKRPGFGWGVVIHHRNERGRMRFGAVTPSGESLLLSGPLLAELETAACWLDGAVKVRLEARQLTDPDPWAGSEELSRLSRPPLVEALAVYFDPATSGENAAAFKQMAGVLTPTTLPSELFILMPQRPHGWPM
jgi:hypothetical protein